MLAAATKSFSRRSIPSQINFADSVCADDETWKEETVTTRSYSDSEDRDNYVQEDIALENIQENESFSIEDQSEEEEEAEDLIQEFRTMSVRAYKSNALKFEYPFLVYPYKESRQKKVCIDMIVLSLASEDFRCAFNANGSEMLIYTRVPDIFTCKKRVMDANHGIQADNSKAVAFEEVSEPVRSDIVIDEGLWGQPQIIKLPYQCDTTIPIDHEMQAFPSWVLKSYGENESEISADQQYHMILSVDIESKEKAVRRIKKKKMKVFKSPSSKMDYDI